MNSNLDPAHLQKIRKEFGLQITQYRKKKELSQRALAEVMGTTQRTIGKIERGEWACSVDSLFVLATYLDFSVILQPRQPLEGLLKVIHNSGIVNRNKF